MPTCAGALCGAGASSYTYDNQVTTAIDANVSSPLIAPSTGLLAIAVVLCRVGGASNSLSLSYVVGHHASKPVVEVYVKGRSLDQMLASYVNRSIKRSLIAPTIAVDSGVVAKSNNLPRVLEVAMSDAKLRVRSSHAQVLCYTSKRVVLRNLGSDDDSGGQAGIEERLVVDRALRDLEDPACTFLGDNPDGYGKHADPLRTYLLCNASSIERSTCAPTTREYDFASAASVSPAQ